MGIEARFDVRYAAGSLRIALPVAVLGGFAWGLHHLGLLPPGVDPMHGGAHGSDLSTRERLLRERRADLAELDDDELLLELDRRLGGELAGRDWTAYGQVLAEIASRDAAPWLEWIEARIAALGGELLEDGSPLAPVELETLRCTLAGVPDTTRLILVDTGVGDASASALDRVETVYPELPALHYALTNDDRGVLRIQPRNGPGGMWPRRAQVVLEHGDGTSAGGRARYEPPLFSTGPPFGEHRILPGQPRSDAVSLLRHAYPTEPGRYFVRVLLDPRPEGERGSSCPLTLESPSIPLVCHPPPPIPLHLTLRAARLVDEYLSSIAAARLAPGGALVSADLPTLVETHRGWHTDHDWEPSSAHERLYQMGPAAVPALVDRLGELEDRPRQRAFLLALLYSITGMHHPYGPHGKPGLQQASALGGSLTIDRLPERRASERAQRSEPLDAGLQEPLIVAWRHVADQFSR